MSSNSKKEKHRLKRLKKKKEARRVEAISPFRRVALFDGDLECYTTGNARQQGLADYIIFANVPGGSCLLVGFLIDFWCVGLKDAWGRPLKSRSEFVETSLEPWKARTGNVIRVEPEQVRRDIAGAIRFSRQNGFRLPAHWERVTAVLGNIGDTPSADLSAFGIDGGLRYVGEFDFLRKRLVGCTVEQFLNRPDVRFITSADSLNGLDRESMDDRSEEGVLGPILADDEADQNPPDGELPGGRQRFVDAEWSVTENVPGSDHGKQG